jgi:putative transposase
MTEMILLSEAQMARILAFFPLSHGIPRVDDRRVISGIVFVIRNGLRWRDVLPSYGPHKTIYNRFISWSELGVFGRIFVELARGGGDPEELVIDVEPAVRHRFKSRWRGHLKAHRTAASMLKKELFPGISDAQKVA